MDKAMTIEEFNTLLTSEKDENSLLTALRKLTTIEKPEDIVAALSDTGAEWWGWY